MTITTGETITLSIGTDYSTKIENFEESGGEKQYTMVRSFGQTYEQVLTGYSDYEVTFDMIIDSSTPKTLFDSTTPVTIVITEGNITFTYYNMLPKSMTPKLSPDDISMCTLVFTCPAYDKTNVRYNRVLS